MQSERMQDEGYLNWLKSSLSLCYVRQAVTRVAQEASLILHKTLSHDVHHRLSGVGITLPCTTCTCKSIHRSPKGIKWQINCAVCSAWLEELLRHHANGAHVTWDNTDPALWHTHSWEVAKVYQPRGCKNHACAEDADVACLLKLMNECVYIREQYFQKPELLRQVINIRNSVMHSASLEVSGTDLQAWTNTMVDLLEDPKQLRGLPECQEAVRKIHELKNNELDLSLHKQLETQALQQRKEVTKQDLSDLETLIRTVESEMNKKFECLKEDMNTFKSEVAHANEHIATRMDKLDEVVCSRTEQQIELLTGLEQKLSIVIARDSTHTTTSVTDRGSKRNTSQFIQYINELQDTLLKIYNQHCRRIAICPLKPDDRQGVDNVYVEPIIEVVNPSNVTRDPKSATTSIYEELFFSGDEECKNIYITGEAGYGKSAFCEKMVSVWCRVHAGETDSSNLSGDERIMSEFPLLFYLSLKHAATEKSIIEMIQNQLVKGDELAYVLRSTKCLIILDGLDEWQHKETRSSRFTSKGIPDRPLITESTIITTTRPWKIESLRLKINEVDKHVKIVGLCESSSGELANSLTSVLCKNRNHKMDYAAFEEAIDEDNLKHFLPVPLILLQLLCLWHENKSFGTTRCEIYSNMIERLLKFAEHSKGFDCPTDTAFPKIPKLPKCFKHNKGCQRYRKTLIAFSKFAFEAIFSKVRNSNHCEIELTKTDIDIGLASGILIQNKVEDSYTERKQCVDFVHNTYREFFAAIYIIMSHDREQVFGVCCSESKILETSDVYSFVYEMKSKVGSLLRQRMLQVVSDDDKFACNRRTSCSDQKLAAILILKIQQHTLSIIEENEMGGTQKKHLQLEHLKVDQRNIAQTAKHLLNVNTKYVKSLCMNTKQSSHEQKAEYSKVFDQISKSKSLERLDILDTMNFIDTDCIFRFVRQSKNTLTYLRLKYVNMSKTSDNVLDILKTVHLESLTLNNVDLTHKQITKLFTFQTKGSSNKISEIDIERLHCVDHGHLGECKQNIDLSQPKIKTLSLSGVDIEHIVMDTTELVTLNLGYLLVPGCVSKVLKCLKNAPKLKYFQCHWCKDKTDVQQLVQILPTLPSLERLELSRANIKNNQLRLSSMMKNLELVELKDMKVSYTELVRFVESLPQTQQRKDVRLDEVTVIEEGGALDFIKYIRESPRYILVTSGNCINFHTDV